MSEAYIVRTRHKDQYSTLGVFTAMNSAFEAAIAYGESIVNSGRQPYPGKDHHISVWKTELHTSFTSLDDLTKETYVTESTLEVGNWRMYFDEREL